MAMAMAIAWRRIGEYLKKESTLCRWKSISRNPNSKKHMSTMDVIMSGGGKSCRTFCLRASHYEKGDMRWYIIKVNVKTEEERGGVGHQSITPVGNLPFSRLSMSAAVGSTLYGIGGVTGGGMLGPIAKFNRHTSILDTSRDEDFKNGPPMIKGRAFTPPVTLGGKIYVFGGLDPKFDHDYPFGEYFDPKLGKWEPLSQPPKRLMSRNSCPRFVFPFDEENIMIGGTEYLQKKVLIYNVVSDSWHSWSCPISLNKGHGPLITVGSTLYWINGMLYAYDLSLRESYSGPIRGSVLREERGDDEIIDQFKEPLFHLDGDEFCFFHQCSKDPPSVIYCTKFRVFREARGFLDAKVVSSQSYIADFNLALVDGLPLDGTCSHMGMSLQKAWISAKKSKRKTETIDNEHV